MATYRDLTDEEWEEQSYRDIADELSVNEEPGRTGSDGRDLERMTLADFDTKFVEEAQRAAKRLDLPWPPIQDVDEAIRLIDEAHQRQGGQ